MTTDEQRLASQCCGADAQENSIGHCAQCGEGTGFDLLCVDCGLDLGLIRAMADQPKGHPDRAMADALMGCCAAARYAWGA
jgi:hypothetical protein|tara:strand:- start:833 stop:1075 length:243 start_codon:yes stop_codon:yes gene_type:complete